jgi:nitrogen fixation/metabolism regulation signal transduction histidine kinase
MTGDRPPTQRLRPVPSTSVSFLGRLEVRVVAALSLLGILCVGASAYLVQLSVAYFDERLRASLAQSDEIATEIEPFYHQLVEAQISAYEARARAIAHELALGDLARERSPDGDRLDAVLQREPDVVALVLERTDGSAASKSDREEVYPEQDFDWFPADVAVTDPDGRTTGNLRVVFRIDPGIDQRYQQLGTLKREIGLQKTDQAEIERAVERVIGGASALVLTLSLLLGFALARTTTRKAGELSRVMTRVAQGDLTARAHVLGRDELGLLGQAFNDMLDELQRAQRRVVYLQRIGAWQEMARRIAHEIKNPLTPIQLAVQQLREKDPALSPEFSKLLRTSVEIVEDEVAALRRMVSSFSQFAKVPQVRLEPVRVARVLDEFQRAYGHLTEEASDTLVVEPPERPATIQGDRQLLKQVLVNLVENAVLSAREAGRQPVRVEVTARIVGPTVEIHVDDNGPGIPAERKESVFEPYETSREQGTGLGLAIVKKVVFDHGGEVWAEDSHLGGARFVLSIPLA